MPSEFVLSEVETSRNISAEVLDFRLQKFDESKRKLLEESSKAGFRILDVGPGFNPPQLSIDLKENDLWVGVDPALGYDPNQKVDRGERKVSLVSKRLLIPAEAETIPPFTPDLIMLIAPNPENIINDNLLEQLEKFLTVGTKIYVLLDNRTEESRKFGSKARERIISFMKKNGFVPDNLEDLGERSIDNSTSKDAVGGRIIRGKKIR